MKTLHAVTASILSASLLSGAAAHAQKATLLVLSKKNHTLSLIDPASLKVTAKVPVGNDPHEVIASDDGRTAWVSNYGFGAFHTLAVVDLLHAKALPPIDLGVLNGPHGLAFAAGKTWFTAEGAKALGRINPATEKVDLVLGTGQDRTHMIRVSPDGQHIVTTNVSSGTVSLIDAVPVSAIEPMQPPPGAPPMPPPPPQGNRTEWHETVLPVGKGSEGFDITPDGREIWVANAQEGTVHVIDWQAKKVTGTIQANAMRANRLKFTPDGRYALVTAGPDLVVIDTHTHAVAKRIPVGSGSGGVLVQPDGRRAFIAVSPDNTVAVLDLASMTITGHIDAGGEPDGMAWTVQR